MKTPPFRPLVRKVCATVAFGRTVPDGDPDSLDRVSLFRPLCQPAPQQPQQISEKLSRVGSGHHAVFRATKARSYRFTVDS